MNKWKVLQIVPNPSDLEWIEGIERWLRKVFYDGFDFVERLITNCCVQLLPTEISVLFCVVRTTQKTFVWLIISNLYIIWGEQSKIVLAERGENGCLGPLWAVCFLPAQQMPGRPASLLCQSQAIRANGSTCLYVGRVWGLLFSGIGLFLFPGSWKTPGSENTLYSKFGGWNGPGKQFSSLTLPEAAALFGGRVWTASFPQSV